MTQEQINRIVENINIMLDQARPAIRSIEEICDPEYYQGRAKYPITAIVGKSIPSDDFLAAVSREFKVSVDWLRTGVADERDPVDDRLIEWLRKNPERARELRLEAGLD